MVQFGKVCFLPEEHAPQKVLAYACIMHVLPRQPVCTLRPSSGWLCQTNVCKRFPDSEWQALFPIWACIIGRVTSNPRLETFAHCVSCLQIGNHQEQHLVFEWPALQGVRDRYDGLFGHHAATMVQSCGNLKLVRTQCSALHAVAQFIRGCMDAHDNPGAQSQASDHP